MKLFINKQLKKKRRINHMECEEEEKEEEAVVVLS